MKNSLLIIYRGCRWRTGLAYICGILASPNVGTTLLQAQGGGYGLGTTTLIQAPAAGSDTVVLAAAGPWAATANSSWLHLSAATKSGTGSTNIVFTFDANPGATRAGTLTIAGQTLTVTQAGSNYTAVSALISGPATSEPVAVAVDFKEDIFATDQLENPGSVVKEWGDGLPSEGYTVVGPPASVEVQGLAVDGVGNLYLSVPGYPEASIVEWLAASSNLVTLAASSNLAAYPNGLAVDRIGNVYIVGGDQTVYRWNVVNSNLSALVSSNLSYPWGVAVDFAENIYITDAADGTVKKWNAANSNLITLVSNISEPQGVAVDGSGNVYFSASGDNTLKEWTAASSTVSVLTSNGLSGPVGIALDLENNIYVANDLDNQISVFESAYVDPSPRIEGPTAGLDGLPSVLPSEAFTSAEVSSDSWITIAGITNNTVTFSFTANATGSARQGSIYLFPWGSIIPVIQYPAPTLTGVTILGQNVLQFSFTNSQSLSFTVLSSTNLGLPLGDWTVAGTATNVGAGMYQFTSAATPGDLQRFYALRSQ